MTSAVWLLLGIIVGYAAAMIAFYVRGRKLPAFPQIPIQVYVRAATAPRVDGVNLELPPPEAPTAPFEGVPHLVTLDGAVEYHGPDEDHAIRVQDQLLARADHGKVERRRNGKLVE